jgi:hypothetical protein
MKDTNPASLQAFLAAMQSGAGEQGLVPAQNQMIPQESMPLESDDLLEMPGEPEEDFSEQTEESYFQRNLAEELDDATLNRIAGELITMVEEDIQSMEPWMDKVAHVGEQIGIGYGDMYDEPFPGCSTVVYPIITKAQLQFVARAFPEIFRPQPADAVVVGQSTADLEAQSKRVADTINYQITYQDPGNKKDFRKMLWWLPLTGSTFRYVYHDSVRDMNMVRFVQVEDFIVPYNTISLEDSSHFTHRLREMDNDLKKLMNNGFYRDVDVGDGEGSDLSDADNPVQKMRDDSDGKMIMESSYHNKSHEIYRVYCYYDLDGLEDVSEEGEFTGVGLPYVIDVHVQSRTILSIRYNYKEDDELKMMRIYYAHYKYQEGPGFYGSGLPHLIGSIQEATTGAMRAFGDSLSFALLPAGWKTEDAKFSGSSVMAPGQFVDVSMNIDDLNKAIKIAQFAPPPGICMQYIEMLDNQAQTIVSTQNIMTGDSNPVGAPVGTTLAMIEQAQKLITDQHQSLYESFSEELRILSDLNFDFLPDELMFALPGGVGIMRRADFSDQIDVIPTANPSVASFQQRQAMDQAAMQMFQMFPQFFRNKGYDLVRRVMTNLQQPDLDSIFLNEQEALQVINQPPPPTPDQVRAQIDGQKVQISQQEQQIYAQSEMADKQLESRRLDIEEGKAIGDFVLRDKEIDARFIGNAMPGFFETVDQAAVGKITEMMVQSQPQPQMPPPQQPEPQQAPAPEEAVSPPQEGILRRLMNKIRGQ